HHQTRNQPHYSPPPLPPWSSASPPDGRDFPFALDVGRLYILDIINIQFSKMTHQLLFGHPFTAHVPAQKLAVTHNLQRRRGNQPFDEWKVIAQRVDDVVPAHERGDCKNR